MYEIYFYKDKNGNNTVLDYLKELQAKQNKNNRIKANKIQDYINILAKHGTRIGEPYIKHIEGEIWELRPLRDRILFITFLNNSYVILHHFTKKTQKTPRKEIEKAKREIKEIQKRGVENE